MRGHGKKEYSILFTEKGEKVDGGHIVLSTKFVPSWYITGEKSELLHKDLVDHFTKSLSRDQGTEKLLELQS